MFLGEHRVDVRDECRNEARMFGATPPGAAAHRPEHAAQECAARQFESSLWKDTALRSIPNMEGRPGVFSQQLLQPQLIGSIHGALTVQASGHELGDVAVSGDRHSDHRPLLHRGIVLVALQCGRILSDL